MFDHKDDANSGLQGYLAHKKNLGPPSNPRHRPTVRSYREAVSYDQGTSVRRGFVMNLSVTNHRTLR